MRTARAWILVAAGSTVGVVVACTGGGGSETNAPDAPAVDGGADGTTVVTLDRTCACHAACLVGAGLCWHRACADVPAICDPYIQCIVSKGGPGECPVDTGCLQTWLEVQAPDGGCAETPDTFTGEPPGSSPQPPKCVSTCDDDAG